MNKYVSFWRLFLKTKNIKKAEELLKIFIQENSSIFIKDEINYSIYEKDNTVKAEFHCEHEALNWEEVTFHLILTIQDSASSLILSGHLDEEVNIFTNNVFGAKGSVSALNVLLSRDKKIL